MSVVSTNPMLGQPRDVRKFTVAFECTRVACEVQFGWQEVSGPEGERALRPLAEGVACSGMGKPGCPVTGGPNGQTGWENCPRMQRLATRLRSAVSTLRTEVPPTPITTGAVMPAGTMD